jgi:hypothetical protein
MHGLMIFRFQKGDARREEKRAPPKPLALRLGQIELSKIVPSAE